MALPSRFTHDAVRRGDRVYICNTHEGSILELSYPSMEVARTLRLFSSRDHINTLAPLSDEDLWVVLHNLGEVRGAWNLGINSGFVFFWVMKSPK